jgi:uracil-DNA glycosylase
MSSTYELYDHPAIREANACAACAGDLPLGEKPIFRVHPESRIAIISQAPGRLAHQSGIPWDDPSGRRLREWLGVDDETFYDVRKFAILPMGFCYPGKGKGGDLPPRPECAPLWHEKLLALMPQLQLKLVIGSYAQAQYLGKNRKPTLTETVRNYEEYLPEFFPLPHPSPRNQIFLRKNPWIESEIIPVLRALIKE